MLIKADFWYAGNLLELESFLISNFSKPLEKFGNVSENFKIFPIIFRG